MCSNSVFGMYKSELSFITASLETDFVDLDDATVLDGTDVSDDLHPLLVALEDSMEVYVFA